MAEIKIVVDCSKGTTAYLPLSAAEIAQRDQDAAKAAQDKAERQAMENAITLLKESAKEKLVAGEPLTEEEAALLIL